MLTDSAADTLRVRSLPSQTRALLLGGDGDDLIQLFDAANTVDNILGEVEIDGEVGFDFLIVTDVGDLTGDIVAFTSTTIEGITGSAAQAAATAGRIGFPVVMKIVSDDILHKTEAGGVIVGVNSAAEARKAYNTILNNAKKYDRNAGILGVQVQKLLPADHEVIVGAVTDPSFGKLVAFGLGGVLV